jgi:hypothetical protein
VKGKSGVDYLPFFQGFIQKLNHTIVLCFFPGFTDQTVNQIIVDAVGLKL